MKFKIGSGKSGSAVNENRGAINWGFTVHCRLFFLKFTTTTRYNKISIGLTVVFFRVDFKKLGFYDYHTTKISKFRGETPHKIVKI